MLRSFGLGVLFGLVVTPYLAGQTLAPPYSFGQVDANSTPVTHTVTLTITQGGSIEAPVVVTDGITGLDFSDKGTGTCTTNGSSHIYAAGDTCTVEVQFLPKFPGIRRGAVKLNNTTGSLVALAYVSGTGVGPVVALTPSPTLQIGSGFQWVTGLAVDAQGNIYATDPNDNKVVKETYISPGNYQPSTILTGTQSAIAVDGAGNLYVTSYTASGIFKETPGPGGTYTASNVYIPTYLNTVLNVAVDGAGVVYASLIGSNTVIALTPSSSGYLETVLLTAPSPYIPTAVAVDAAGNVYVVETVLVGTLPPSNLIKLTPGNGGVHSQTMIGSNWLQLLGMAVDAAGSVYVSTGNDDAVMKETPSGTSYTESQVETSRVMVLDALAVDPFGNLFVAGDAQPTIQELAFSLPQTFDFPATTVGGTSSTIDQQSVLNNGNAPLLFAPQATMPNPLLSAGFGYNSTYSCPVVAAGAPSASTLLPGASCTYELVAQPVLSGSYSGQLVMTNNNYNLSGSQQTLPLNATGFGSGAPQAPTVTAVSPASGPAAGGMTVTVTGTNFTGDRKSVV